ncbi:prepilin-type N-terminal cleavage/methylation domain-containing protein [Candidatus Dependentiae bacterium]|nr:prepilin-type N-terminal cleavage/methylation domain-containing protein [Candidatus Dependentiae bacterium]
MKNSRGFTLIEVLVAMAILVSTVYVLSDLHIRSMFRLMRDRDYFLHFFTVKSALMQQFPLVKKDFKPRKEKLDDEGINLTVALVEPNAKSPVKDILGNNLALVQVVGSWKQGPFDYDVRLMSVMPREEPLNDDKKS